MIEAQKKLLRIREGRLQNYNVGNDVLVPSHLERIGDEDEYGHACERASRNNGKCWGPSSRYRCKTSQACSAASRARILRFHFERSDTIDGGFEMISGGGLCC